MRNFINFTICALAFSSLSACGGMPKDSFGVVYDTSNAKPIAGAYVVAEYRRHGGTFLGHSASVCTRTEGMFTGNDGRYRFKGEQDRSISVRVARPGYHPYGAGKSPHLMQDQPDGSRNLLLTPQDPEKPRLFANFFSCEQTDKQGFEANLIYLNILLDDVKIYQPESLQFRIDAIQRAKDRFK